MKVFENYSLLKHNTFGLDVKARCFVEFDTVEEVCSFFSAKTVCTNELLPIGGGSNLLFLADYQGTVLHVAVRGIEVVCETEEWIEVRVGAGELWDDWVDYAVEHNWFGVENLSWIPGEVGASAVQNIGAYGVEAKDVIVSVDTVEMATGKKRIFTCDECGYAYRYSVFKEALKGQFLVTSVTFRLSKLPVWHLDYGNIRSVLEQKQVKLSLKNLREVIIAIRKEKLPDPAVMGNAGSFFMNPVIPINQYEKLLVDYPAMPSYPVSEGKVKIPAGWLIDQCGWKGRTVGRAGVHQYQALVLVNLGGAEACEIVALAQDIARSVCEKFGIVISPEVNYIG